MKNVPKKIYLQISEENEEIEDFNELSIEHVTWCVDRIFENDIEFRISDENED